jgi:tRNA threonylcarbamoyladenosine biosynthesis protein TsaE
VSSPAIVRVVLPLADAAATAALAARVAPLARPRDVIALGGELGTGKTHFARAFIRTLAEPDEEVPSPTFSLVQTYDTAAGSVWHFDLYRIRRPEEALELGIEDALAEGIVLIEWPDRLGALLPPERLDVMLAPGTGPDARTATIDAGRGWASRLRSLAL